MQSFYRFRMCSEILNTAIPNPIMINPVIITNILLILFLSINCLLTKQRLVISGTICYDYIIIIQTLL